MSIANVQVVKEARNISVPDLLVDLIPISVAKAELSGNILAFVILAIFVGVALLNLKEEESKPLIELSKSLQAFSMKIVEWAMKLAAYAVFGLICSITIKIGFDAISSMFMYIFTVVFGFDSDFMFLFDNSPFSFKNETFSVFRKNKRSSAYGIFNFFICLC